MVEEIIYTSSERGLKKGSRGFCTVISTAGMALNLAERLESLSGYRHAFPLNDPQAALNPINFAHLTLRLAGRKLNVLSRVSDAGQDYTGRSNKLAHHVVLDSIAALPAGPARLLAEPGTVVERWDGTVRTIPARALGNAACPQQVALHLWKQLTGDGGWAGAVAEMLLQNPAPVSVIFRAGTDNLSLVREVLDLLPSQQRWDITFSTYFTRLLAGTDCQLRFILDGTPEATTLRNDARARLVDLTRPLPPATGGVLVEQARSGTIQLINSVQPPSPPSTRNKPHSVRQAAIALTEDDWNFLQQDTGIPTPPEKGMTPPPSSGRGSLNGPPQLPVVQDSRPPARDLRAGKAVRRRGYWVFVALVVTALMAATGAGAYFAVLEMAAGSKRQPAQLASGEDQQSTTKEPAVHAATSPRLPEPSPAPPPAGLEPISPTWNQKDETRNAASESPVPAEASSLPAESVASEKSSSHADAAEPIPPTRKRSPFALARGPRYEFEGQALLDILDPDVCKQAAACTLPLILTEDLTEDDLAHIDIAPVKEFQDALPKDINHVRVFLNESVTDSDVLRTWTLGLSLGSDTLKAAETFGTFSLRAAQGKSDTNQQPTHLLEFKWKKPWKSTDADSRFHYLAASAPIVIKIKDASRAFVLRKPYENRQTDAFDWAHFFSSDLRTSDTLEGICLPLAQVHGLTVKATATHKSLLRPLESTVTQTTSGVIPKSSLVVTLPDMKMLVPQADSATAAPRDNADWLCQWTFSLAFSGPGNGDFVTITPDQALEIRLPCPCHDRIPSERLSIKEAPFSDERINKMLLEMSRVVSSNAVEEMIHEAAHSKLTDKIANEIADCRRHLKSLLDSVDIFSAELEKQLSDLEKRKEDATVVMQRRGKVTQLRDMIITVRERLNAAEKWHAEYLLDCIRRFSETRVAVDGYVSLDIPGAENTPLRVYLFRLNSEGLQ